FFDVDRHHARYAGFLHRNAEKLLRDLHGDLVVADKQELRVPRHLLHELAETLRIVIVERGIDLIEQAERRRIELKQGEHQGQRREGLFAPGEQVNRAVLLAGRLRDDLYSCVEDLVTGQHQARSSPCEQRREHLAKMPVDLIEGSLQALPSFATDRPGRIRRGRDRLVQIPRLSTEVFFALARRPQLLERSQVDRAELLDLIPEPHDFGLQRGRPGALFQHRGEVFFPPPRLGELASELLFRKPCLLLLQPGFADLQAHGLELLLTLGAVLIRRLELQFHAVQLVAHTGESVLALLAPCKRVLQPRLQRLLVVARQLFLARTERHLGALAILRRYFNERLYLIDLATARTFIEGRLLERITNLLQCITLQLKDVLGAPVEVGGQF